MPKKSRYDDAFDNLWAEEVSKPGEYSQFEQENNITITATTNNNDTKLNQQQSSTSIIKSLFDYYSNNTNNRKAKPLIPRLRFIDFISSLNLPLESRQYTRQQASLIYQNLTKENNCTQMSFNIFQYSLFEISKFLYNDLSQQDAFNQFLINYLNKAKVNIKKKSKLSSPISMKNKVRSPTLGNGRRGSPKNKFIKK